MAEVTTTTEEKKKNPTVQESFQNRETQNQAGINKIYDSGLKNVNTGLQDAFAQNQQLQAQQAESVRQSFNGLNGDLKVQNDRNDTNLTQFADVRDLNYQPGSQHQLRLNNARNASNAKLAYAQQQALQESERQAALIETNYKNQVAAALADNDYKRAAALMDDYNNQDKWRQQQAETLASFGDFNAYKDIYGEDTADTMQTMWNAQHPEEAYRLGRIDANKYRQITGKWPRGYTPPSAGWDTSWYTGYVPGKPNTVTLPGSPVSGKGYFSNLVGSAVSGITGKK